MPLPAGTPEAFRDRLEMLRIHPIVNSGGARHLPKLVAEDVLVEDFADPKAGELPPESPLITALGFSSRLGLSRIAIEQALLARGAGVLEKELGVDPRAFRLVCIPPDVHLRLGEAEGWDASPSGHTSTDTSSWPTGGCAPSPGATRDSAACTTSSASAGTTIPTV